jgi:hypothetical protein
MTVNSPRDPAAKVLNTTELLTAVLLNSNCKELVVLMRVCKQWHEAIKQSKRLQVTLCLEPFSKPTYRPALWYCHNSNDYESCEKTTHCDNAPSEEYFVAASEAPHDVTIVNPFLRSFFNRNLTWSDGFWTGDLFTILNYMKSGPSLWKETFLCQPPTTHMCFGVSITTKEVNEENISWISDVLEDYMGRWLTGDSRLGVHFPGSHIESGDVAVLNSTGHKVQDFFDTFESTRPLCLGSETHWKVTIGNYIPWHLRGSFDSTTSS